MIDAEWETVCGLMEDCWAGELDEGRAESYRTFLDKFESGTVLAALHLLAEGGSPFLPRVPELIKACRNIEAAASGGGEVPAWSEAWRDLMRAVAHGGRGYFDSDAAKQRKAIAWLDDHSHPIVARFFDVVGWREMANTGWEDDEYGAARRAQLMRRWDEFVDVARARLGAGLALGAIGRRSALGQPRRLDQAALLEGMRAGDAPQLGPGKDEK